LFKKRARKLPWLGRFIWRLEAGLLGLFWFCVRPLSPMRASELGYKLFYHLGLRMKKNRYILPNLGIAFPEMTQNRRQEIARKICGNFGAVLAEYPHMASITINGNAPAVEVIIDEMTQSVIDRKQPAIYVTAHLGNWELGALMITILGMPLSVVYSPQKNPFLDQMIQAKRETLGCGFITKDKAVRQLIRELRAGRSVGLLPDQRVDNGEPVPYFGVDALTTTAPAWLAIRMECPLIPVQVKRIGAAKFRVIFHAPIDTCKNIGDPQQRVFEVTKKINHCFEQWIHADPEHWLCIKRRWPKEVYKK
jgi:KDO2-lipid IV(A) lauroyltransferase